MTLANMRAGWCHTPVTHAGESGENQSQGAIMFYTMDITPPPEFLEACRCVLGGDSPRTNDATALRP